MILEEKIDVLNKLAYDEIVASVVKAFSYQ
jgi:hypothetical protein